MNELVYSPKEKIPLFKVVYDSFGNRYVEYKNYRTGSVEQIKASRFVIYLLETELASDTSDYMIYTPKKRIPLGFKVADKYGGHCIEVKYKKKKECIRFSTYVSLILEYEALKAS